MRRGLLTAVVSLLAIAVVLAPLAVQWRIPDEIVAAGQCRCCTSASATAPAPRSSCCAVPPRSTAGCCGHASAAETTHRGCCHGEPGGCQGACPCCSHTVPAPVLALHSGASMLTAADLWQVVRGGDSRRLERTDEPQPPVPRV